jgi:hypothetical protein
MTQLDDENPDRRPSARQVADSLTAIQPFVGLPCLHQLSYIYKALISCCFLCL